MFLFLFLQQLTGLDRVILKGSELLYNVFWLEHAGFMSGRTLVVDVPSSSFVVVNIGGQRVNSLNVSRVEFVGDRIDKSSLIFNFFSAREIDMLTKSNQIDVSMLAPRAELRAESDGLVVNGQLFVGSLKARGLTQTCSIFEPFF